MRPPKVTIGLPVYNAGSFLADALRSVFAQTEQDWELIVAEDGSTDGTLELLSRVGDPRLRVLSDGQHRGVSARMNQIAQAARGRYLARMDGDDVLHPLRIEKQLAWLEQHRECDVVGTWLIALSHGGSPFGVYRLPATHEQICANPLRGIMLSQPTVMARSDWFRAHPYNQNNRGMCEDRELWLTTYTTSRFANLQLPLYFYRDSLRLRRYVRQRKIIIALNWERRRHFGRARTAAACAMDAARICANALGCAVGAGSYFLRRRSRSLTPALRAEADGALNLVRTTSLPASCALAAVAR